MKKYREKRKENSTHYGPQNCRHTNSRIQDSATFSSGAKHPGNAKAADDVWE
jgi:hypothetical protein